MNLFSLCLSCRSFNILKQIKTNNTDIYIKYVTCTFKCTHKNINNFGVQFNACNLHESYNKYLKINLRRQFSIFPLYFYICQCSYPLLPKWKSGNIQTTSHSSPIIFSPVILDEKLTMCYSTSKGFDGT